MTLRVNADDSIVLICYLCEQPILEGQVCCELEVDGLVEDAHRPCVDQFAAELGEQTNGTIQ